MSSRGQGLLDGAGGCTQAGNVELTKSFGIQGGFYVNF